MCYHIITTCLGHLGLVGDERGLTRLYLPEKNRKTLQRAIQHDFPNTNEDKTLLLKLADDLRRYFAGEVVEFDVELNPCQASAFTRAVWEACHQIPYGQICSYQQLAERAGHPRAARAVGTAMRRNPYPIVVPCHRVLKSDGSLGGYSGTGGVEFKRQLLEMEAAGTT